MSAEQKMDKELMRRSNMRLVLSAITSAGAASRAELSEVTGMSVVSVGRIADALIALGLVQETRRAEQGASALGRPPAVLSLQADKLLCCGACLDGRDLHLALVDPCGALIQVQRFPYPAGSPLSPAVLLPWLADRLEAYLSQGHAGLLDTVGLALPGIIDVTRGEVRFSANLHWQTVAVTAFLQARLPAFRFVLENDVKAAVVAEHSFGAAVGRSSAVLLSIGSGIGAAVILNGALYRGKDNRAGEIGHVPLNPAGKLCACGRVGCLQTNLEQSAILSEARSVYPGIDMEGLLLRYGSGDPFAVALLERVADYICTAVNLLSNTYAPEMILLGGSLFRAFPPLRGLAEARCLALLSGYMRNSFSLGFERFESDGAVIGAGALAFRQVLDALF